jgi:hypothetical protein
MVRAPDVVGKHGRAEFWRQDNSPVIVKAGSVRNRGGLPVAPSGRCGTAGSAFELF